jgi:multiple antibiotic resistance protein
MNVELAALLGGFGRSYLFVIAALLPIVNPAAVAPVFLTLTEGADAGTRASLAKRIATNSFALMLAVLLMGSYVLDFFGISLPIVRVGGGLIVAATAWRLLTADQQTSDNREALAQAFTPEQAQRQGFYPLTFPVTCGPGSIAAIITVGVSLNDARTAYGVANSLGGAAALASLAALIYFAYRYAQQILRPLGEAGTLVFTRLTAFILLCLGIQIMWDGTGELLRSVLTLQVRV